MICSQLRSFLLHIDRGILAEFLVWNRFFSLFDRVFKPTTKKSYRRRRWGEVEIFKLCSNQSPCVLWLGNLYPVTLIILYIFENLCYFNLSSVLKPKSHFEGHNFTVHSTIQVIYVRVAACNIRLKKPPWPFEFQYHLFWYRTTQPA